MTDPEHRSAAQKLVLPLDGELDVARSDEILAHGDQLLATAQAGQQLVVDMSDLSFIDSSGLSALLRLRHHALAKEVGIALHAVPEHVAVLLRISGLEEVLPTD